MVEVIYNAIGAVVAAIASIELLSARRTKGLDLDPMKPGGETVSHPVGLRCSASSISACLSSFSRVRGALL